MNVLFVVFVEDKPMYFAEESYKYAVYEAIDNGVPVAAIKAGKFYSQVQLGDDSLALELIDRL